MKNIKYVFLSFLFLCFFFPAEYQIKAENKVILSLKTEVPAMVKISPAIANQLTIQDYVYNQSVAAGINPKLTACLASHESQWVTDKEGDIGNPKGSSWGLFQISISQHNVTKEQATNYVFATQWTLNQIKLGNVGEWTTYWDYCESIPIHENVATTN